MSLPTSLASLTRVVSASETGPVRSAVQDTAGNALRLLPHLEPAIAVGLLTALAITCVILLGRMTHIRQRRRASATASAWLAGSAQKHASSRRAVDMPPPLPAATAAELLRTLESSPRAADAADHGWHTRFEDIPGVGRIEWDPQTLRAFACQPDVLDRLAYHRWRLQQGMLSEFDLVRRTGRRASGDERGGPSQRTAQPSPHAAPPAQGLRALSHGQQAAQSNR
jgi:hypothetical protein